MGKVSSTTVLSIVAGAALGAFAAVLAKAPALPPEPPRAVASRPEPPASPTTALRAPPAPSNAPPPATPEASPAPPAPSLEVPEISLARAEQGCARHAPRDCLAAAKRYASGRDGPPKQDKARLYRVLAASMLIERCTARDPEACNDLSELYAGGIGVPTNAETAAALTARAKELCAGRETPFCSAFDAGETH
jgi:hypothetical protein